MNILSIIEMCGGDLAVAFHLNLHQQTIKRWTKTYVPKKYRRPLAALAGSAGYDEKKVYKQLQEIHIKLNK